ncbi:inosine/xanthosine triphosphatase [Salinibacillus kushneri]|uniref:inosine/xanthosine triphosphatase n=1 Tax=Salinibacillus kushneri TaxID=237682 RepID=A0A1I0JD37_9BACI|nr:DUF84 family protein [Salinibacillus kushneri]SEU07865.1 inosine/xanthosine triphosphatase [Salinibacillus kushneri]
MKIIVGSQNPAKLNAVKAVFPKATIEGIEVDTRVSSQPFSDEETLEGAINRAKESVKAEKGAMGIGLEGGVMEFEDGIYLCNWGSLVDTYGNVFTAGGARIPLPEEIKQGLEKGKELGDLMDEYTQKQGIRKKEGAIGIFTNQQVSRGAMFTHVVRLLRGQYEFLTKQTDG